MAAATPPYTPELTVLDNGVSLLNAPSAQPQLRRVPHRSRRLARRDAGDVGPRALPRAHVLQGDRAPADHEDHLARDRSPRREHQRVHGHRGGRVLRRGSGDCDACSSPTSSATCSAGRSSRRRRSSASATSCCRSSRCGSPIPTAGSGTVSGPLPSAATSRCRGPRRDSRRSSRRRPASSSPSTTAAFYAPASMCLVIAGGATLDAGRGARAARRHPPRDAEAAHQGEVGSRRSLHGQRPPRDRRRRSRRCTWCSRCPASRRATRSARRCP